jgi:hypothetical protein
MMPISGSKSVMMPISGSENVMMPISGSENVMMPISTPYVDHETDNDSDSD